MMAFLIINLSSSRENRVIIMEFLQNSWIGDRRAEWSIWMVYSRVEMPHRYLSNRANMTSLHGSFLRRSLSIRRSKDEVKVVYIIHVS